MLSSLPIYLQTLSYKEYNNWIQESLEYFNHCVIFTSHSPGTLRLEAAE